MIYHKGNLRFSSMKNTSNTKLLIHSDTTDASTTFTDSASSHAITANGDVQHDTAQAKWGGSSILFDGTGDYLSIADHADWDMGDGNVTVDFWVRFSSVTGNDGIFQQYASATSWLRFWVSHTASQINLYCDTGSGSTELISVSYSFDADKWYHVALIRGWSGNANDWAITVDGASAGTKTSNAVTWPDVAAELQIGSTTAEGPPELTTYISGHIDEFRVVKGEAMWTSNFNLYLPMGPYS
jgi:hypothetical protein